MDVLKAATTYLNDELAKQSEYQLDEKKQLLITQQLKDVIEVLMAIKL